MVALGVMTAQELFEYSHEPFRTELVAGKLCEMEPAGALHGVVAARICELLSRHVRAHDLGVVFGAETGFQLESDPDTVRAPDASFVSRERIVTTGIPNEFFPGPPDVAFEVTSPGDRRGEVQSKTASWLAAGTHAVIVVDPRVRTATIRRGGCSPQVVGEGGVLDLEDVLAGFAPAVDELFH
jgi:Uma2 family endonuclease